MLRIAAGRAAAPLDDDQGVPAGILKQSFSGLTDRELEVLGLFMKCLSDKLVARQLRTSIHTVRNQIASIEHKIGVRSREELVKRVLTIARDPA